MPEDTIIFLDEIEKIKSRAENLSRDNEHLSKDLIEKNKIIPEVLTNMDDYLMFCDKLNGRQTVYLEKQDIGFVDKQSMHAKRNGYSFSYREVNFFRSSMDLLFKELQEAIKNSKWTVILAGSSENVKKISTLLDEHEISNNCLKIDDELALGSVNILPGALSSGFECYDLKLLLISVEEIFETKKKRLRNPASFKEGETIVFADLRLRRFYCT